MKSKKLKLAKGRAIDPVYEFFVHETVANRKRAYDNALKAAEADQKEVLRQYELEQNRLKSA